MRRVSAIGKKGPVLKGGNQHIIYLQIWTWELQARETLWRIKVIGVYEASIPCLPLYWTPQKAGKCSVCTVLQPKSRKALGSTFKASGPLCLPSSTGGTRGSTSEDQPGQLGWEVSWGTVTLLAAFSACSLFDLMVLQLFELNTIPAEIYRARRLKGTSCLWLGVLSKPSLVRCWLGLVVMVGKCVALVPPGDVVEKLESLMSSFQESLRLIRQGAHVFSWKCPLSRPWIKRIKEDKSWS